MNRQEAAAVLGLMAAAWPNHEMPSETALVWADMLGDIDPDDGLAAARQVIQTSEWFPTINTFREAAQAVARKRARELDYQDRRALPAAPIDPIRLQAYRFVVRELLAKVGDGVVVEPTHRPLPQGGGCRAGCPGCQAIDDRVDQIEQWLIDQQQVAS